MQRKRKKPVSVSPISLQILLKTAGLLRGGIQKYPNSKLRISGYAVILYGFPEKHPVSGGLDNFNKGRQGLCKECCIEFR